MDFQQFYLGCLAHASYLVGSHGEAAVIDPQRDVDQYIRAAERAGLTIKYVIETHLHADFVSGHRELAEKTGAQIVLGANSGASLCHLTVKDGDKLAVGDLVLTIFETPGHTPESICVLAQEVGDVSWPAKLFSGDTLFIGSVGRPDLAASQDSTAAAMAGLLYDSLHGKLLKLSDDTEVYPAHGAGSLCGKGLSSERMSTIGLQKQLNYALQPMSKAAFIEMVTADLPETPAYFPKAVALNREGAVALDRLGGCKLLAPAELSEQLQRGALVLDLRSGTEFAKGHIKGSLNVGLDGQFASWAGTFIQLGTPIVLLADGTAPINEAVTRLARIGIETVIGSLENGISAWAGSGFAVTRSAVITVAELKEMLELGGEELQVVDVRRPEEYQGGHLQNSINVSLADLPERVEALPKQKRLVVICGGGYRSAIAASILERAGIESFANVLGGTAAWKSAGYAEVTN